MSERSSITSKLASIGRDSVGIFAFLFVISLTFLAYSSEDGPIQRTPNSLGAAGKLSVLKEQRKEVGFKYTKKLAGPLRLSVSAEPEQAIKGQAQILRGTIESSQHLPRVAVEWDLPDGVKLESGSLKTSLLNLNPGEAQVVEITVFHESESNQQVHLSANAQAGEIKFGEVVQFNTVDQQAIEIEKEELLRINKSYSHKNRQKVMY